MYDYWLGGMSNTAADRTAADAIGTKYPSAPIAVRANRSFLRRAVRYLAEAGVDQFLDLGSGIPTVGNVHEIAQAVNPAARVVYVDLEPVAVAASRKLLAENPNATIIRADLRDVGTILAGPDVRGLLDFDRPIAVLMVSVLHFVPDEDDPEGVVATYRDALAPGSHLVLSHVCHDYLDEATRAVASASVDDYRSQTDVGLYYRDITRMRKFFVGVDLLPTGIVSMLDWRPDDGDTYEGWRGQVSFHAGVGRKA
jgi:SAM-dependent methyltransferase